MASSASASTPAPSQPEVFGPDRIELPAAKNPAQARLVKGVAQRIAGLDYARIKDQKTLAKIVKDVERQERDRVNSNLRPGEKKVGRLGNLPPELQAPLATQVYVTSKQVAELGATRDGVRGTKLDARDTRNTLFGKLGIAGTPNRDGDYSLESGPSAQELADRKANQRFQDYKEGSDASYRARGGAGGGPAPENSGSSRAEQVLYGDDLVRHRSKILQDRFGTSSTLGTKLAKAGLDPDKLKPGAVLDAQKYSLNSQSVRHFSSRGIVVVNQKGIERKETGGYSARELASGRLASGDSVQGQARLERRRGLFGTRTEYESDGRGGLRATELEPRFSGKSIKAAAKAPFAAAKRSAEERRIAREEKRLGSDSYRAAKIARLERSRNLVNLQGRISDSHGFRRWLLLRQLDLTRFFIMNKAWVLLTLGLAVLFAPWIGIATWSGYVVFGLGITSIIKAIVFAAVNAYNLVANLIVSGINLFGNTVSGIFERGTAEVLKFLRLDPIACDVVDGKETCTSRLFSYTYTRVDTSFPGFPELSKPASFDTRTLFDVILRSFGIKFNLFNSLRRILFPEE